MSLRRRDKNIQAGGREEGKDKQGREGREGGRDGVRRGKMKGRERYQRGRHPIIGKRWRERRKKQEG